MCVRQDSVKLLPTRLYVKQEAGRTQGSSSVILERNVVFKGRRRADAEAWQVEPTALVRLRME